jgi:SprT-like family
MNTQDLLQENGDLSFKPERMDSPKATRATRKAKPLSFKLENAASIQPAIAELERLYSALALRFGNLADRTHPRILIQTRGRKRYALGWVARNRWQDSRDSEKATVHEITICAESLARSLPEIAATLTHEMVHLSCHYAGVQDVGKDGRYHNRKFKAAAEAVGLVVEKDHRIGWSNTSLGPELAAFVSSLNPKDEVFAVFRVAEPERPKQPTKMKKWVCTCPVIVRCAVKLTAVCTTCNAPFVLAETAVGVMPEAA